MCFPGFWVFWKVSWALLLLSVQQLKKLLTPCVKSFSVWNTLSSDWILTKYPANYYTHTRSTHKDKFPRERIIGHNVMGDTQIITIITLIICFGTWEPIFRRFAIKSSHYLLLNNCFFHVTKPSFEMHRTDIVVKFFNRPNSLSGGTHPSSWLWIFKSECVFLLLFICFQFCGIQRSHVSPSLSTLFPLGLFHSHSGSQLGFPFAKFTIHPAMSCAFNHC